MRFNFLIFSNSSLETSFFNKKLFPDDKEEAISFSDSEKSIFSLKIFIKEFLQFLGYSYLKFRIEDVIISPSKLGKFLTILQFTIINYMFINLLTKNYNFSNNIYFKLFIIIFIILLGLGLLQYSLHGTRQLYAKATDIKITIPEKIKQILKI